MVYDSESEGYIKRMEKGFRVKQGKGMKCKKMLKIKVQKCILCYQFEKIVLLHCKMQNF